jgi:hypothetical protein
VNHWGEPDDIEPLPDWMLAETHRNPNKQKQFKSQTVEDAAKACLKKPTIDVSNYKPEIK